MGGRLTGMGEFPHMASIGWRQNDGSLTFKCGGSLISERFVLTAAHCSSSNDKPPSFVRLGDQNLRHHITGEDEIDVAIAKFIPHEKYNSDSFLYDVAVIKLAENVKFSHKVLPACLWSSAELDRSEVIATGWGVTESRQTSDELLKADLDIIDNKSCNEILRKKRFNVRIEDSQMCAGVLSGGKDTCDGGETILLKSAIDNSIEV